MSSRSTSPTPSSRGGGGSESGGVASLSNDALYTPLSSLLHAGDNHPSNNNQTQSKQKSRHSLSLQTSSSLRESSLVTFLTSVGNNIKTSHPQECHVYRGLGGKYGTGDGGRADKSMRNTIENKLSNRSLVLVGGGIHTYTPATISSGGDAKSGGVARSNKRKRKRVGGNGVFGCKSHRQRKKALGKVKETQSSKPATNPTAQELDDEVGNIVETLHKMWTNYIQQILSPLIQKKNSATASIRVETRKEVSLALATSEHIGMAATIVACPSRRHLVSSRCIVLDETKETFKIAILKSHPEQAQKKATETSDGTATKRTKSYQWKVVMIPKHRTSMDVSVPILATDRIVVRLET